jgi:hypothetical protein
MLGFYCDLSGTELFKVHLFIVLEQSCGENCFKAQIFGNGKIKNGKTGWQNDRQNNSYRCAL